MHAPAPALVTRREGSRKLKWSGDRLAAVFVPGQRATAESARGGADDGARGTVAPADDLTTEQRARGDVVFSDALLELGRSNPNLWSEIRMFFRKKEMATAMLVLAHEDLTDEEIESRQMQWDGESAEA